MSKNMTRKGLAFGAGLALVGTGFVAIPAQANVAEIMLQPLVGTEFVVPSGNVFELQVSPNSGYSAVNGAVLKFDINTNGTFAVQALAADATTNTGTYAQLAANKPALNDTNEVLPAVVGASNKIGYLGLSPASADDDTTYTVKVQAWEDTDGDDEIDSGEWNSDVVTVTFLKHSDVTFSGSIVAANVTNTTVEARFTSPLNLALLNDQGAFAAATSQFAGAFYVGDTAQFNVTDGTAGYLLAGDVVAKNLTYSALFNRLSVASPTLTALTAGQVVKAQLWMLTDDTAANIADGKRGSTAAAGVGSFDTKAGAANVTALPAASSATGLILTSVSRTATAAPATALGQISAVASSSVANSGTGTADVLAGAGTFTARVVVTPATGQSKSGIAVTWTVFETAANSIAEGAVLKAGTAELKNTNGGTVQSITATSFTDADGVATLVVSYTGATDRASINDQVTVDADVNEIDGADAVFTFTDNAAAAARNVTAIGASAEYRVAVGAAFTLRAGLTDLFGSAINDAAYTVTATDDSTTPRTITAALVNGVATLSMPSYATAQTRTITLQGKKNGVNSGSSSTVTVVVGAQGTPAQVTLSGAITGSGAGSFGVTTAIPLNTKVFTEVDTRVSGVAPTLDAQYIDVTALVLDATNAPISADITFSGAGLDFVVDGVYKKNEITVRGTGSGNQTVRIYSSVAGTKTLTVKAGTVTKTEKIYFAQPAATAAKKITITSADTVASGKTLQVSGIVEDAFGNGVNATDFVLSYTGPGFYGSLPTTLVNGKFSFNVLISANETGTATITAAVYTGADQISATKQVKVGQAAGVVNVGSFNGRLVVYAKDLAGSRISWKVGGNWGTAVADSNYAVFNRPTPRRGVTVSVDIYVNGVKTLTKSVVTR